MKISKIGLMVMVTILFIGIMVALGNKPKTVNPVTLITTPTQAPAANVSNAPTIKPTVMITSAPRYSEAVKAQVRSEFIKNCTTKGHYSVSECNCAADYLAANYAETELAKIYVQYHSTSQVPNALVAAEKACKGK
jgi:hypothetical protein